MKLCIENTLGIVRAEIDLEPGHITEVVGPNASWQDQPCSMRPGSAGP